MRFEIYCDDEFNPCMDNLDWNPWMRDSLVEYIGDNHSMVLEAPNYDEVQRGIFPSDMLTPLMVLFIPPKDKRRRSMG